MTEADRIKYLRIVLWVFGLTFIFGVCRSPSSGLLAGRGMLRVVRTTLR